MASPDTAHALLLPRNVFASLGSLPRVTGASLGLLGKAPRDGVQELQLDYSLRNWKSTLSTRATQSFHLPPPPAPVLPGPIDEVPSEIVWQGLSPDGARKALFRATPHTLSLEGLSSPAPGSCVPKLVVEIRDVKTHQMLICQELTQVHRFFVLNDTFGFPSWNHSGTGLAYVAECHPSSQKASSGDSHEYIPDFGEQLNNIRLPAVFVIQVVPRPSNLAFGLTTYDLTVHRVADDSVSASNWVLAQPTFGSQSSEESVQLFCTGFFSLPDDRRLGLIYCQNRLSAIFQVSFKTGWPLKNKEDCEALGLCKPQDLLIRQLTDSEYSARSPRFMDGQVYFLSNHLGGPHASCASLKQITGSDPTSVRVLVDIVDEPDTPHAFPGLYVDRLPIRPFLVSPTRNKTHIVLNSIWGSLNSLLTIDLESGQVKRHLGPCGGSCTVWDADGGQQVLCAWSETCQTPQIWIGTLSDDLQFSWRLVHHIKASDEVQSMLSQIRSEVITMPHNAAGPTDVVLTSPSPKRRDELVKNKHPLSLIVSPHGGPHSTYLNEFSPATAALAISGYSTAYVNYPGSLGYGQKWVCHLVKHLGLADVESCQAATMYLISRAQPQYDRLFVQGGSHGGFITAHLTCRYPNLFHAACMRNPVVDLVGTASGGSDIPDWSFAEANLEFRLKAREESSPVGPVSVDRAAYEVLREASPIASIGAVKTPTLLLLGQVDRRVSHQQGLAWYHGLRGLGVEAKAMMFKSDSHPLSSVEAEVASFEASLVWFSSHS